MLLLLLLYIGATRRLKSFYVTNASFFCFAPTERWRNSDKSDRHHIQGLCKCVNIKVKGDRVINSVKSLTLDNARTSVDTNKSLE